MKLHVIDSHTGGEPTRVVVSGVEVPKGISAAAVRKWFDETQTDLRDGLMLEPRATPPYVGVLIFPSIDPECSMGILFFNSEGSLGMCGHGTIGLVETLRYLGIYKSGEIRFETPVGVVLATGLDDGSVQIQNVASYLYKADVSVYLEKYGMVVGDIAYGGNWFFLVKSPAFEVRLENERELNQFTSALMDELESLGIRGKAQKKIDHIEVFGSSTVQGAESKSYVLCPNYTYDRSPCGTGTSAKLASLVGQGKLEVGERYVQESFTGSTFTGWIEEQNGQLIPYLVGKASIMADSQLFLLEDDIFRWGIR
jgi:4-hydroxyproline epimerase